jgi:hypothetical protein
MPGIFMVHNVVSFFALVFTALALIPYGAHLFALPNKIGMTEAQYFIAQSIYNGWALFGIVLFPAMLINLVFAFMLRRQRMAFWLAATACLCMAATLVVFFDFTYPANVATANWVKAPANWAELRQQWEYSHAANAVMNFVAFCLISLAVVMPRRA